MSVKLRHVIVYEADPVEQGRRMSRIVRQSMQAAGDKHAKRMVAARFTPRGASMLNYKPRHVRYQVDKRKSKGHSNPYQWSGDTKRKAKGGVVVRATKKRIVIRVPFSSEIRRFLRKKKINVGKEFGRVSGEELKAIARDVAKGVKEGLDKPARRRKKNF